MNRKNNEIIYNNGAFSVQICLLNNHSKKDVIQMKLAVFYDVIIYKFFNNERLYRIISDFLNLFEDINDRRKENKNDKEIKEGDKFK